MPSLAKAASTSGSGENLQAGSLTTNTGVFIYDTCVVCTMAFLLLASAEGKVNGQVAGLSTRLAPQPRLRRVEGSRGAFPCA